jgi:hypothetical protein
MFLCIPEKANRLCTYNKMNCRLSKSFLQRFITFHVFKIKTYSFLFRILETHLPNIQLTMNIILRRIACFQIRCNSSCCSFSLRFNLWKQFKISLIRALCLVTYTLSIKMLYSFLISPCHAHLNMIRSPQITSIFWLKFNGHVFLLCIQGYPKISIHIQKFIL